MSVTTESSQVENVVASSDIGQEPDLETLSEDLGATDYDPDNFLVSYIGCTIQKLRHSLSAPENVCTGAKSVDDVTTALEHVFDELRELGVDVAASPAIEIQNIVSSGDLDHTLNLNAIAIGLGLEHIEYEPEQFPGLVYRLDDPDIVAHLFGSGKLVITGGKQLDDAEKALTEIENQLNNLGLLD